MKKSSENYHLTAGGIIYRNGKVAMLRDRWGKLVIAKGHVEKDEDLEIAAKREVTEETGYKNLKIIKDLGKAEFDYMVDGKKQHKVLHQFLFELEDDARDSNLLEEHEIYTLQWLPLGQALKQAAFGNTKEALQKIQDYYQQRI